MSGVTKKRHTFQLLFETTATGDAECTDKLFKIDLAALVGIEYIKDVVGKFSWISKGEELLVDATEFCFVEMTRGTVFLETFVPRMTLTKQNKKDQVAM